MSKLRQAASRKSDGKLNQPKISAFFKKPALSNQKSTSSKFTHIRADCEVVLESPECKLPIRHCGGVDEDNDPDVIPATPQQSRSTLRLFTHTNSRASCSSPECEVIPPTPPRAGKQTRPRVSLTYELLKSQCNRIPIPPTDLKNSLTRLPLDKSLQAKKGSCLVENLQEISETKIGPGSTLPLNVLSITCKRDASKTEDIDTRIAKKPKLEKFGIENIPPNCKLMAPALSTKSSASTGNFNVIDHPQKKATAEADESGVSLFDDDDFWAEFVDGSQSTNDARKVEVAHKNESTTSHTADAFHDDLPIRKYNRHKVQQVVRDNPGETLIMVSPIECSSTLKTCLLKGFWADTQVGEGDIVNVLGEFNDSGTAVMGGEQMDNLLVVNPDHLVSTTTVVAGVFCRRKSVLNEWFRAVEQRSIHMLVGTLVHQLFQEAAERRLTTPQEIRSLLAEITKRKNTLLEIYGFQGDKDFGRLYSDLDSFVKPISGWIRQHVVGNGVGTGGGSGRRQATVNITQIRDIEENVWCPRLGLKGKIDMVVETSKSNSGKSLVPLELKTGRPTFSAEHEGQVTLYRMMGRDRRSKDVEGDGLLMYLRTGECQEVKFKEQAQQQLIQMRNEVAWHLAKPIVDHPDGGTQSSLAPLPDPLGSRRVCSECPLLTVCSLLPAHDAACRNSEYAALRESAVKHLMQEPKEYFFKWCLNVFTEDLCTKNSLQLKDVWCEASEKREARGECFSGMVLKPPEGERQGNVHRFERCAGHRNGQSLLAVGFERMQSVVVSIEKRHLLALGTGLLKDVREHYVDIVLDRDLYSKGEYKDDVFRIDAYRPQTYSITALSNLARLMDKSGGSTRLRGFVVGYEPLKSKLLLTRAMGKQAQPFFENLNRQQKIAMLMALATEDYLLIEGTPGSGKTKTIVAIIRMLLHMGKNVLMASHTHSAVDNVLLKLKEKGVENFIRLGKTERINPGLVDHTSDRLLEGVDSLEKMNQIFNGKQLVATTCLGSNHALFQHKKEFDYCIVDEATQILQPVCLGPLFLCKRFILVGDPQQLPPVVRSPIAKKMGMDESMFFLLKSKEGPKDGSESTGGSRLQLLTLQYRMNAEVMRFSNALSYAGQLESGSDNKLVILNLPKLDEVGPLLRGNTLLTSVASTNLEESVLLLNTDQLQALEEKDAWGKICSRVEATIALEIVTFFLQCGLRVDQVGVISPYRNQVALIKKFLVQKKMEEPQQFAALDKVEVNTIDQYQGREKDAVIISFVGRSKAGSGQMDQEILSDKRRINVAITRAKTKMVMIGSREILRGYEPLEEMLKLLRPEQVINLTPDCITSLQWPLKAKVASL